jgi:ribosome-binding protein aMBF1 (putative translation factor)
MDRKIEDGQACGLVYRQQAPGAEEMNIPERKPITREEMIQRKELGLLLRSARIRKGWSQRALADQTGLAPGWISQYELGLRTPRGVVLQRLKRVLEV